MELKDENIAATSFLSMDLNRRRGLKRGNMETLWQQATKGLEIRWSDPANNVSDGMMVHLDQRGGYR